MITMTQPGDLVGVDAFIHGAKSTGFDMTFRAISGDGEPTYSTATVYAPYPVAKAMADAWRASMAAQPAALAAE